MSNTTITPLMGLVLPVPEVEVGPEWAQELVAAFNKVDSHNHMSGEGALVPMSGITINANLSLNDYAIEDLLYAVFKNNASPLSSATRNAISVSGGELYYNDNSGNQIKLTSAGGINLTSIGQIGGDYSTSTASVAYNTLAQAFTFTSNTGIYAKVSVGDFKIFERVSGGNSVQLLAPTGLGASYNLTFPITLPGSTLPMLVSSSGVISSNTLSRSQLDSSVYMPVGCILPFAGAVIPAGWLLCNGAAVSRTTYLDLYLVTGNAWGYGDNSTTFNLPDFRGMFLRGVNAGAGRDPDSAGRTAINTGGNSGDNVGSFQGHAFQTHNHAQDSHNHTQNSHNHNSNSAGGGSVKTQPTSYSDDWTAGAGAYTSSTNQATTATNQATTATNNSTSASGAYSQTTGNETRPINAYVNYIIKY